ncbi:hypothetical protein [Flammeovirga sp. SJP92]|uniref:hypothetical protein n=1 Tax=Flammeovirga sp. SJP92 TaxID=1775430 RepID=UPI00079405A3|nr:hypothetical protein [Flammeovirga sp. SJP92]KXX72010.1 hypothetical protein AVL50_04300 [Flammeovirga sp. SJP92]
MMRILLISVISIFIFSTQLIAQDSLDRTRIIFKSGKFSNSTHIEVEIHGVGITEMMASGSKSFEGARWIKFSKLFSYHLSDGDGLKEVYFKFKDVDGNESKVLMKKITLDTTPPTDISVKIDVPTKYFTDPNSLKVGVILGHKGAKYFQISNTSAFHGNKWRLIQDEFIEWDLAPGDDGVRKVYARYRDQAGNITSVVTDEIIVDRTAPFGGKISINNGEKVSNRQDFNVDLTFFCRQADSMLVAQSSNFEGAAWEPYNTKKSFKLSEGDGIKQIFVKYKDLAGNQTQTYSSSITMDTSAPQNITLSIDQGAESTTNINKLVTLELNGDDAAMMMVSNNSSFQGAHWQQVQPKITNWKLSGEADGKKHVYVKFKDDAGNISRPIRASIELKRGF